MDFLSNYMRRTKKERMDHVDLSSPCDLSQSKNTRRKLIKHLLLLKHELIDDVFDWQEGTHINICHCCSKHSGDGYCANPDHAYLGTHAENQSDKSPEARQAGGKASPGREFTPEERSNAGKKGGKIAGSRWSICKLDGALIKACAASAHVKKLLGIDRYTRTNGELRKHSLMLSEQQYEDIKNMSPLKRLLALGME